MGGVFGSGVEWSAYKRVSYLSNTLHRLHESLLRVVDSYIVNMSINISLSER